MEIGIVGLPNVGKSSLFNALTNAGAQASNFPFTTIEPNVGIVSVPGERLGNKFLSHIRSVDAIAEVVRVFDDPNVIHVHGGINPDSDISTINTELLLDDLEVATKSPERLNDQIKKQDKK